MTSLPFETTADVRFQDLDALGHVNNAVYATYVEEGRIAYFTSHVDLDPSTIDTVVAHLELDFERPVTDPSSVTVGVGTTHVGERSYTLAYEVEQHGELVASGETVQVWIDRETGNPAPIPESVRGRLETDIDAD